MKHSRKLFMFVSLLLVVGLLFAALPAGQVKAQAIGVNSSIQRAADRIVELQRADGGWGWPLTYPEPDPSAPNIVGPIGKALAEAYRYTNDPAHLAALQKAGAFLLNKTKFSATDYEFAAKLDSIFNVTTYTTYVKTNFYDKLAAGTYNGKSGGPYSTQTFVNAIRAGRSGDQANMAAWDLGMSVASAVSAGVTNPDLGIWIAGLEAEINELNGGASNSDPAGYYDVIGLAGGVYGLAVANVNFDPTAGEHAAANSTADLAAILASYQINNGGFAWNKWWVIPNDNDESMQETSYAILALNTFNRALYLDKIQGASNYAMSNQMANGGWLPYAPSGEENVEVNSEILWGITQAYPYPEVWVCPTGSCGHPGLEFSTIQAGIDIVDIGGIVHVEAGTYPEQININKRVSIIGSGREGANATIITSSAVGTVLLGATGTSTSPILLKDLQVTGAWGIRTNITPIAYFTMDNVWLNANPVKSGEGFRIVTGHQLTHLTINNSIIEGYIDGMIVEKNINTGDSGTKLQYVNVTDTIFRNNYRKGLYTETLSDAVFTNVQLINNGYVNPGTNLAEYNSAGFDLNLKYGAYSNLSFINMTATANGLKAKDGAALMIKARSDGGYAADPATLTGVTITGGSFTGNERGIRFGEPGKSNAGPTNVVINGATILNNVKTYTGTDGSAYGDVVNYSLAKVNATVNWWGSAFGPQAPIYGNVDVIQWCADAGCTTFAPNAQGVIELSGTVPSVSGGINIYIPGLTYKVMTGAIIRNSSPCFNINASHTHITYESIGGGTCVPTDNSNGINVAAGLEDIRISGLVIDGTNETTGDGIHFDGAVNGVVLVDNYIHGLDGDGIEFAGQPAGVINIQGNLFTGNTGLGINAGTFTVDAEYNSWGKVAGPAIGTDITSGVIATPFTHADLSLASAGTSWANTVVKGLQTTGIPGRPTVLKDGNTYHLWAGDERTATKGLYHYVSTDPTFSGATPVKATFDAAPFETGSPAIIKEGNVFYMIYYGPSNQTFSIYTSNDGNVWAHKGLVFDAGVFPLSTGEKIDAPFIMLDGSKYRLYFQVKLSGGTIYNIFTAESTETLAAIADGNVDADFVLASGVNPVLIPGAGEGNFVMHPWVVKDGSTYYMWYTAPMPVSNSIGLATSSDGYSFVKAAPGASILGPNGEPVVINDGGVWRMWYMNGASQVGYMTGSGPETFNQTITYKVQANLVNVIGSDFVLTYPAQLSYISSYPYPGFDFKSVVHNATAHTLTYSGLRTAGNLTTASPVDLLQVTFSGNAVTTTPQPLLLSGVKFGMASYESSQNVYPFMVSNGTVSVIDLPTLASTFADSYYLVGEARAFTITTNFPSAYGATQLKIAVPAGVTLNGVTGPGTLVIDLPAQGAAAAVPTTLTATFSQPFNVTAAPLVAQLFDGTTPLADATFVAFAYDKPTLTITQVDPYYIEKELGNFSVRIQNPITGRDYGNAVWFDLVFANHNLADITSLDCYMGSTHWPLTTALGQDGANVKATLKGLDGYFTVTPNFDHTVNCTITYDKPGDYVFSDLMLDVVDKPTATVRPVSDLVSGTAVVYAKPVITADGLAGPYQSGTAHPVTITINPMTAIYTPNTFVLHLALPSGTVVVYDGITYTCGVNGCDIPVTLVAGTNALPLTITLLDASYPGPIVVDLIDTQLNPDRTLATLSQALTPLGTHTVTGTISMQGRVTRGGVPLTLTDAGGLGFAPYNTDSFDDLINNYAFTGVAANTYTFSTNQNRYLNVTVAMNKKVGVSGAKTLQTLELRGGNVAEQALNVVDLGDATLIGGVYGTSGNTNSMPADANFDGVINIQDLAMVGGNFNLTGIAAYAGLPALQ